jgi:hypothetical protein
LKTHFVAKARTTMPARILLQNPISNDCPGTGEARMVTIYAGKSMQASSHATTRRYGKDLTRPVAIEVLSQAHPEPPTRPPSPGRVRALEVIRRMRGASHPWLLRCDDGCCYVVKFQNNPQHPRIIANEMLASRLAQLIGLPVPTPAVVVVPPELVEGEPGLVSNAGNCRQRCAPGLHFGSRFPGPPEQTIVVDFLPDMLLRRVDNLAPLFLGGFVFDKWTCNCDGRQAVFFRHIDRTAYAYSGLLIDQGFCFNGSDWNFPDSPIRSLYPRRVVYDSVTGLGSFEPFLSRIESLTLPNIEGCIADIPSEWCFPDPQGLQTLVNRLYARRCRLADLIIDAAASLRPFRNWSESA